MIPRSMSYCVKLILQVNVVLMASFPTSSSNQCPQSRDPVVIRNVGIKLCQFKCNENSDCLSIQYDIESLTCRLLRAEPSKTNDGSVIIARNHPDIPTGGCASKKCNLGQRCLESRSGKAVCVDATPSPAADCDLYNASRDGDLDTVRRILSVSHADLNRRRGKFRWTPVMAAVYYGHREVVKFLVDKGADMSPVGIEGTNILHLACMKGDKEIVELILSLNLIDINAKNYRGNTAVNFARTKGYQQVLKLLVSRGAHEVNMLV